MDVFAELTQVIVRELAVAEEEVVPDAHLEDDLGADSLFLLNLAETLEKKYSVEILLDDLVEIPNVAELVAYVEKKLAAGQKA